jgi:hypothetical protein
MCMNSMYSAEFLLDCDVMRRNSVRYIAGTYQLREAAHYNDPQYGGFSLVVTKDQLATLEKDSPLTVHVQMRVQRDPSQVLRPLL